MAALLALLSSLVWGAGDFLGGRASRSFSVLQILAWSQIATFTLLWLIVGSMMAAGAVQLQPSHVLIAAAGGVAGVIGLAAFYRALAIGPMAVVPPLAAMGVALPVIVGLATGSRPSSLALGGLAIAVVGVVLASAGEGGGGGTSAATRITPATLGLCAVAAGGFALIFVAIDAASGDSARTALAATACVRLGSFAAIVLAVLLSRARPWAGVGARPIAGFAMIGLFDTGANLLFAMATTLGELELVAVLGSLYPAVTSALAHIVLGERLGRIQFVGVLCTLVGVLILVSQ